MDNREKAKLLSEAIARSNDSWHDLKLHTADRYALHGTLSAIMTAVGEEEILWIDTTIPSTEGFFYEIFVLTDSRVIEVIRRGEGIQQVVARMRHRNTLRSIEIRNAPLISMDSAVVEDDLMFKLEFKDLTIELKDRNGELGGLLEGFLRDLD